MKKTILAIMLVLCAACAWADEVLGLRPLLAETARVQGQDYVEHRDQMVATVSTNALARAVDDERLDWRERLVGRIVLERASRKSDIQSLRRYDWPKDPEFDPEWSQYVTSFAYDMGPMADKRIHAAGLWYYYLEINWKDTQEATPKDFGWRLREVWPSYLMRAVREEPETWYLYRVMMERLADDPGLGKHLFVRHYDGLIQGHYSDAVSVLLLRYDKYLEMQSGKISEPVKWPYDEGFRFEFRRILSIADVRHYQALLDMVNQHTWLEPCRKQLEEVRQRPAPETVVPEPPFRIMPTPEFLKNGPFVEEMEGYPRR